MFSDPEICLRDTPPFFRIVMHSFHIITIPVYIATLIVLFREPSKAFQTYKYYIIVHILINIISEVITSYFVLPDTYLPYPLFRMTGWLAHWGFSGIFQFYCLAHLAILTGLSVLEMFYYRFKVCIFNHEKHLFSKLMMLIVNIYRLAAILHLLTAVVTFNQSLEEIAAGTLKLWNSNSSYISREVLCYNAMLANADSIILFILMTLYIILAISATSGAIGTLIFITNFIRKSVVMSVATQKLQKMLIVSLVIQGGVHGAMILAPILLLMYAFFFELHNDKFARFFVMMFAQHGFASTCAMILFTKPLRDKILPFLKKVKIGRDRQVSTVPVSTNMDQV